MPTWSIDELMCVNDRFDTWIDSYEMVGGVPRLLFCQRDVSILIRAALASKGRSMCENLFSFGFSGPDAELNYVLLHINPTKSLNFLDEEVYDYTNQECSFASAHVFETLCQMKSDSILAAASGIFNTGAANMTWDGASAGNLFEKVCLWTQNCYFSERTRYLAPMMMMTLDSIWLLRQELRK
jgi:hypothetical protein